MKKISIIMMALALVMGMSQCKKNEQQASNNGDEIVFRAILSNGSTGSDESKIYFAPEENKIINYIWNAQDIVYVGANGHCYGYLFSAGANQYGQSMFSGKAETIDVDNIPMGATLDFFTLAAKTQTIERGTPDYAIVSYDDQSYTPAVVNWGQSDRAWVGPEADYECMQFLNYSALVKFTITNGPTTDEITIAGVKNQVKVYFDGTFESLNTEGNIITYNNAWIDHANNIRYAVVPMNLTATSGDVIINGHVAGTYNIPGNADRNKLIKGTITLN